MIDQDSERSGAAEIPEEVELLSQRRGRLLFDGRWLAPSEVPAHHRRLKWRSFSVVLETLGVVVVLLLLAYLFYLLAAVL